MEPKKGHAGHGLRDLSGNGPDTGGATEAQPREWPSMVRATTEAK